MKIRHIDILPVSGIAAAFLIAAIMLPGVVSCAQNPGKRISAAEYKLKVLETLPHERNAYTQGLFFDKGQLYESTGQYGASSFRKVDLKTGKVLRMLTFDSRYFAEGSCVLDGRVYILTWQEHKCFVYSLDDFKYLGEMRNPTEGWGLTSNGKDLIMSDGTDKLYFLDPMTFSHRTTLEVKMNGRPLRFLNELEYIDGKIWANVYLEDYIVVIDPQTGAVTGKIDCRNLLPASLRNSTTDVLNGIAYNPADGAVYLTGKYWPKMYKVEIVKK